MITVAFTVSGSREGYLRQALDSWAQVRGIENASLLFCVEPVAAFPLEEFRGWVQRAFPCPVLVCQNARRLNTLENTRQAFSMAFTLGAEFAVLAEEDLTVGTDVLEYLAWASEQYRDDQDVIAVCSHARDSKGAEPWQVVRASWFNPLVCGTWKDRWESFVLPTWGTPATEVPDSQAWDVNLRLKVTDAGKCCVFPALSRVMHIGEYSTWAPVTLTSDYFRRSQSSCYSPDLPPQEYRQVDFDSVPVLVV